MIKKKTNDLIDKVAVSKKSTEKKSSKIKLTKEDVSPKVKKSKSETNRYDDYLESVKEICDLALMNGDLRSAISAKKLEADWVKQNKAVGKEKIGINSMSEEELESLVAELEEGLRE